MSINYLRIVSVCFLVSGCGLSAFVDPITNPIIEDSVDAGPRDVAATIATTANRRLVILPLTEDKKGKFCAEPSPDAGQSVVYSFAAALNASNNVTNQADQELKAELGKQFATSVASLTKRTQGLQFFRDGVFALCQNMLNGFMGPKEYTIQLRFLRDAAERLIMEEIKQANWNAKPVINIPAPTLPGAPPKPSS